MRGLRLEEGGNSKDFFFQPCELESAGVWRTSRRVDEWTFEQDRALDAARTAYMNSRFPGVRVNTLYKRKINKV